jgi:transcription initiation factor TFIID subunit 11
MTSIVGSSVNKKMGIAMSGIAKVFVGELIEAGKQPKTLVRKKIAKTSMDDAKETGALRPNHIRTAFRHLKTANKIPYAKQKLEL